MLVYSKSTPEKSKSHLLPLVILLLIVGPFSQRLKAQSVMLYTPYTKISVPPGESINYDIDVINNGSVVSNNPIYIYGLPKNWTYTCKSAGLSVEQISILPKEKKTISLSIQVPLQVNKGTYHFTVSTNGSRLPLAVEVSQKGTFKTEFTTDQPNMEGASNATFTYTATLKNGTSSDQTYALSSDVPPGWDVNFKVDYKEVSSVSVPANQTKSITVTVNPPDEIKAGDYKIPLLAANDKASADLALDLKVTGSYDLKLSTSDGLLSTKTTAGDAKKVQLTVTNTGSAPLTDVNLTGTTPPNWEISFDPQKIEKLEAGASATVTATIKSNKNAIAGDYMVNLEGSSAAVSSKADLRVSVETSILSGWLGLLIILIAIGSVYYLFKRYGRR